MRTRTTLLPAVALLLLGPAATLAQNPITRLEVRVTTGNDDLREGSQAFLTWQLRGEPMQRQSIIRRRERLPDRTTNVAQVVLPRPIPLEEITEIGLDFVADRREMMGDDEWVVERLVVTAHDTRGQRMATLVDARLRKKFAHTASWRSGPLARARPEDVALVGFEVTVETGDDDFRAGSGLYLEVEPTTGNAPIRLRISPGRRLVDRTSFTTRAMLGTRDTPGGRILARNVQRVLLQFQADRHPHTVVSEPDKWELRGVAVRGIAPDGHVVPLASSGAIRLKLEGADYWVSAPLHPRGLSEIIQALPATALRFSVFTGEDDLRGDSLFQLYAIIRGHEYRLVTLGANRTDEYLGTYASLFKDRTESPVSIDPAVASGLSGVRVRDVERIRIKFTPGEAHDDVARALVDKDRNNLGLARDQWELLWVGVFAIEPRTGTKVHIMREFRKTRLNTGLRTWTSGVLPSFSTALDGYGRAYTPARP